MADNDPRIEELLARWQAEPGSRVFVQLAEEYRRVGKLNEALKVLEAGLKRQPNYLSAKIALGRCRLETGEAEVASEIFQEVLRRDATNLVANKLQVEAYLEAGNLAKAREQLNLYGILNDRDPDIDDLKKRIEGGGKPRVVAPEPEFAEEPVLEVEALAEPEAPPAEQPEPEFEPLMEEEEEPFVEVSAAPEPEPAPAPPTPAPTPAVPEPGDVFGGLFQGTDEQRYLQGLAAEGLFGPAAPAETAGETSDALFDLAVSPAEPAAEAGDIFGGLGSAATQGVAPEDEAPVFNLPPVAPGTTSVRAPEAGAHPMASVAPEAEEAAAEAPEEAPARSFEDAVTTMVMPAMNLEEPPATATLGQLYLQQGHREEARRIFRRVLQREPAHPVALAALQALEQEDRASRPVSPEPPPEPPAPRERPPVAVGEGWLTARQLLPEPEAAAAGGLTARKVALLNNYLHQLRSHQGA